MSEKGCKYCTGVYREGLGQAEVTIYPRQKRIVATCADVDMLGQNHITTVEIPCKYCPNCGRKL